MMYEHALPAPLRTDAAYVTWVQASLNRLMGAGLVVDGKAGSRTRAAVAAFQRRVGLRGDGKVGTATERALVASGAATPPAARSVPPTPGTARAAPGPGIDPCSQGQYVSCSLNEGELSEYGPAIVGGLVGVVPSVFQSLWSAAKGGFHAGRPGPAAALGAGPPGGAVRHRDLPLLVVRSKGLGMEAVVRFGLSFDYDGRSIANLYVSDGGGSGSWYVSALQAQFSTRDLTRGGPVAVLALDICLRLDVPGGGDARVRGAVIVYADGRVVFCQRGLGVSEDNSTPGTVSSWLSSSYQGEGRGYLVVGDWVRSNRHFAATAAGAGAVPFAPWLGAAVGAGLSLLGDRPENEAP